MNINQNTNETSIADALVEFSKNLTNDEKKTFDEIDKDAFIEARNYFASLKNKEANRRELIKLWFEFFQKNEDYEAYCEARRKKSKTNTKTFEKKFPAKDSKSIAEIYEDWGDIHAKNLSFDDWFSEKKILFNKPSLEVLPVDSIHDASDDGRILVSLPKGIKEKNDVWTAFTKYWKQHYFPTYAAYAPKYDLNVDVSVAAVRKLEMAILVDDILLYDDPSEPLKRDSEFSHNQVAKTIMFNPLLRYRFGLGAKWRPDSASKKNNDVTLEKRLRDKNLKMSEFNSKKPHIVELEQYYAACVESTIKGIFPA